MNYKEKYEQTLAKAKDMLNYKEVRREDMEYLFHELKESEDKRVKETLIKYFKECQKDADCDELFCGLTYNNILTWLEKQGENVPSRNMILSVWELGNEWKGLTNGRVTEYGTQLEYIQKHWNESEYYLRDKQDKQKTTDKVEPKFENGQWIVWQDKYYKVNYNGCGYELVDQNGLSTSLEYGTIDENAHLWDITKDAKDGDVLVYGDNPNDHHVEVIMIFKSLRNELSLFTHFHIFDDTFRTDDWCDCGINIHPANKEQRGLLFQKMKEAGYEWDAEKKELKKIEQNPVEEINGEDYGIDGLWHAQQILERTLGKVEGYQSDDGILEHNAAITAVKKLYKQKPVEWSEEDNIKCEDLIKLIEEVETHIYEKDGFRDVKDWLRTIKDRVHPQPKQEWSEEDKGLQEDTLHFLEEYQHSDRCKDDEDMQNSIACYNWLKALHSRSNQEVDEQIETIAMHLDNCGNTAMAEILRSCNLRPQPHWKPSDEQMHNLSEAAHCDCAFFNMEILKGLYDDLKKLRRE